jgi:hypothetical protein
MEFILLVIFQETLLKIKWLYSIFFAAFLVCKSGASQNVEITS